ncbi:MAG: hypothetical protein ACSLFN_01095 [Candidatus Limnocylindrales bacterium]
MTDRLPARDLVDVRLAAAIEVGGCALCEVRSRGEIGTLDTIIAERVLDLGFRGGLERDHGFCRRHARGLLEADRRSSGILGSSILFGAMVQRRTAALREAMSVSGRRRRSRLANVRARPPCLICGQGGQAVETATSRLVERCADPAWAAVIAEIPFCLDDLALLLAVAGDEPAVATVAERQLARLDGMQVRLEGFADHSAQDRRHLLTDAERGAADEAARLLGGS